MLNPRLQVAIVGGGLGGTILMHALTKYPQLDVQLYEAKDAFKERGASVGLMENAQRAMRLLGMGEIVQKAQGVELEKFRICLVRGQSSSSRTRVHGGRPHTHISDRAKE